MALFDAHPGGHTALGRSASSPVPPPTPPPRRHRPDAVPQPTPFSAYSGISPAPVETVTTRPAPSRRSPYGRHRSAKSPGLGMAALALTIGANLTTALGFLPMMPLMREAVALAREGVRVTPAWLANTPIDPNVNLLLTAAGWAGIIAFIMGIVAAVTHRGRGMGVIAIVVSIIGPVLVTLFWILLATSD